MESPDNFCLALQALRLAVEAIDQAEEAIDITVGAIYEAMKCVDPAEETEDGEA